VRIGKSVAVLWFVTALLFSHPRLACAQSPLPPPWQTTDVGDVGAAGTAYQGANGDLIVAGAGADIWGSADSFRYVYQPIRDGYVSARVASETNTHPFAKTGVMIRQSLDPGSPEIVLDVKPDGGLEFMTRPTPEGETTFLAGASVPVTDSGNGRVAFTVLLNLFRSGGTVVAGYCLLDDQRGSSFCTGIGSPVTSTSGPALAGVAVTSHDPSQLNHAVFPGGMPTVRAVPDTWLSSDIGNVGVNGFATYEQASGTFYVSGAGSDMWGSADSFHAVSQWLNSDSMLTARVVSEQNTHTFAKAGIEFGDTSPSASRVLLDVKPDGGLEFMARTADGAAMSFLSGMGSSFPVFLRLDRTGDRFDALISPDARTWTTVGSVTLKLPTTVRAALVVTSHDPSVLNTAQFDHVSVTSSPAPTGNLLQNPGFEDSVVPEMGPGWVSDSFRQAPAQTETAMPHSGSKYGACETTTAVDCGIYQDLTAPANGNYLFTAYVAADKPGVLLGVNVNGVGTWQQVQTGGYAPYAIGRFLRAGDAVRVWLYSPASPGNVFIDDASLAVDTGPR